MLCCTCIQDKWQGFDGLGGAMVLQQYVMQYVVVLQQYVMRGSNPILHLGEGEYIPPAP